jgi:hypothetical protein
MARARFLWENECVKSGVTITASGSATGYPSTYLANRARWKPWRSTTTTGNQNVVFDFGTAKTITAVCLVNWRKHGTTGTIKAEYWTGAAYAAFDAGTGLFTLPSSNRTRVVGLWYTPGRSTSRIRITFTNTGAVSDYVEVGVCVAGAYVEPAVTLTDDLRFDYTDPSSNVASDDGQEVARQRTKFLALATEYVAITAADKNNFFTMFDTVGCTLPFIYAVDATDADQVVYGRLTAILPAAHQTFNRWNVSVPFLEVR